MITKQDCLLLLDELEEDGVDTSLALNHLMTNNDVTLSLIKFINDNRQLDANLFYEKIRKSYNNKRSILYKNLVREDLKDANEVLTTLSSLQLQIFLYMKNVKDKEMFMRHMRIEEISGCITTYSKNFDLIPCLKLLQLIKADLKAFEYISRS